MERLRFAPATRPKGSGEGDNVVVGAKGVYAWQNGKPGGDGRKSGDKVDRWRFFTHLVRRASICIKQIASFFLPSLSRPRSRADVREREGGEAAR